MVHRDGERNHLSSVYVNCWEDHTRFKGLYRILDEIELTVDTHRQSPSLTDGRGTERVVTPL